FSCRGRHTRCLSDWSSDVCSSDLGTCTISNDDGTGIVLQFTTDRYTVNENDGSATITVLRSGGSNGAVSVSYNTSNGSAIAGAEIGRASRRERGVNYASGSIRRTT